MGSVKDLEVIEEPSSENMGIGRFRFSDRYSVFDWGEMPDLIESKGAALCVMGAYCFEELEKKGVKTHYRGLVSDGEVLSLDEVDEPTDVMEVDLARVIEPDYEDGYDYSVYREMAGRSEGNFLIPLEVIYRNGLPEGSSVFRRHERGEISPSDFGLEEFPEPGSDLEEPLFDVSTKLEERDRYISWSKAREIAGLTDGEVDEIKDILGEVNQVITKAAEEAGFKNEDGKIELAFNSDRDPIVVDVVGTLDECRFTWDGFQVSKQVVRNYYKNTEWHKEVNKAKEEAEDKGIRDWRELASEPPKINPELKEITSNLYKSAANELTGKDLFKTPSLESVIETYKNYDGKK
ncbi:phosphoribosylaminoimidazolesuccinocarboxamide synthase [Methanonatronarchaeum sp. AMET6-2]|uniref:phosphoribosylaminoimidazolesuccinocarboxamide synthase n=1 Tax=Methanonatronarchaeum sp. AMET6-2 TaxID=2933293 RepID=UPI00121C4BC4|nr:phosphoribosylaminoimidazolesuccinocarboxamide synthase [Methanonatronarchaeum sp. AMET6-2]RZN63466.1 MAG: phosphoribosylaminoimidazolesuccinocarboxamide synthase [Methanonatronarchaeia archaeon]UOY09754.1 phosphoribosylaminoimidazolesuccinocarboxamide synthase [Methanonatronarchaeum sp. AMET6-2]